MRNQALTLGIAVPLLAALAWSGPAVAQLTTDQEACVLGLGRGVWKIEKAVAKQASTCLTDFVKGEVASVEACVASDPTGKIAKMTDKATEAYGKFCTPPPDGKLDDPFPPFGATDATTVITEGTRAAADLAHDLFGADLDGGALSTDRDASSCQRGLWKAVSICALMRLKNLSVCQKDATATATSRAELRDACLGAGTAGQPDPTGKIAKKCSDASAGIPGALAKKCDGQDLNALVPGCANAADVGECVQQKTACRACLAASQAQDLDRDCDLFDDGLDNASCDRGPIDIVCDGFSDATMMQIAPGGSVNFQGSASHPAGIDSVTVNGTGVAVAPDGSFGLPVTVSYGVNFVDVVATNAVGEQRAVTCTFIAAGSYLAENGFVTNGYNLALTQSAIDDSVRFDGLDSLAEVLAAIVNSSQLRTTLESTLAGANPLKPSSCDQETCSFFGCICFYSSEVTYASQVSLPGPNTVSLALVNGGFASVARIENVSVRLRARGTAVSIPYDVTGFVTYDFVQVNQVSDVTLDGSGRPNVAQRAGSLSVTVGTPSFNFGGLDGFILNNVVAPLASGGLRTLVQNATSTFVTNHFNNGLDALLSGIDLVSGSTINVPTVDGSTLSINLAVQLSSSSVNVTAARALFGMASRFTASSAAHAISSLGIALTPTSPPVQTGTAAIASGPITVVNQALHALWRGGLFETAGLDLDLGIGGTPPTATVQAMLPPVALPPIAGSPNKLRVGIGGVRVLLTFPGLFDEPIGFEIGADMSGDLSLAGNGRPQVTNLVIDVLHRTDPDVVLDATGLSVLDAIAPLVLQQLVSTALDDAMTVAFARSTGSFARTPEFPIPSFFTTYGLPSGSFGVLNPSTLGMVESSLLVFRGGFGLR